ncbi:hypothetical protein AB0M29_36795 [Streptomyces sp. NPDC051976]|uniref:alpha-amylase family glycosyl hydrolase n=1 Tax=Streptomyces sp. NPDC051976 TaxID=3154947 RepID=UPI003446B817
MFDEVLRLWLDWAVDGFRINAAVGLFKYPGLSDSPDPAAAEDARDAGNPLAWKQPEVNKVWRCWRAICDTYTAIDGHERILAGEVVMPAPRFRQPIYDPTSSTNPSTATCWTPPGTPQGSMPR